MFRQGQIIRQRKDAIWSLSTYEDQIPKNSSVKYKKDDLWRVISSTKYNVNILSLIRNEYAKSCPNHYFEEL
jgi:hypothetical protein